MTIAWSKFKHLIAEEGYPIYDKRALTEVWTQIKKKLFDMLPLGNGATSNETLTESDLLRNTIELALFGRDTAGDGISECFE